MARGLLPGRLTWVVAVLAQVCCAGVSEARAGTTVSGSVRMPDLCSPSISPAVVYLTTEDGRGGSSIPTGGARADVALVNQRDLQFVPRIQVVPVGTTLRFTNQDGETHNVHIVSPGFKFNQSMAAGSFQDFAPSGPGVMRLACDIHQHMRGYVVVSPTPWAARCDRFGHYELKDVPAGKYRLTAWHEMGDPVNTEINVPDSDRLTLPELVLTSSAGPAPGTGSSAAAPARPWTEVIDRISVALAASRDAATRPGEEARARRLADDAYWVEFEASDMETAVRKYLGFGRARALERQFTAVGAAAREVAQKRRPVSAMAELSRNLIVELLAAARELGTRGVNDRSALDRPMNHGPEATAVVATEDPDAAADVPGDPRALLHALERGFRRVVERANQDAPDEAAAELTTVYMTEFEPLERYLLGRSPQAVRPLEIRFNQLRGDLTTGLKGDDAQARVGAIVGDVEKLLDQLQVRPVGAFGPAFVASLVTIVREGIEVILVIAMLLAVVSKASRRPTDAAIDGSDGAGLSHEAGDRAKRAIWWGVGLAGVASILTAVVLNALVVSASGQFREILEGVVLMTASAILFYVSYWLVAQAESKRWLDFLKRQANQGLALGGRGALAVTAFLAVYREGAETALMFQAMVGAEARTRAGLLGVTAGLALGFILLAVIAYLIRATSVRLPLQSFFKLSGMFLFALAIAFAGNGVFELQNAGILITTNVSWIGRGLPWLGIYPNLQVLSVQALLLAGAILAWVVVPKPAAKPKPAPVSGMSLAAKRS